jgi:hypothetical protein
MLLFHGPPLPRTPPARAIAELSTSETLYQQAAGTSQEIRNAAAGMQTCEEATSSRERTRTPWPDSLWSKMQPLDGFFSAVTSCFRTIVSSIAQRED